MVRKPGAWPWASMAPIGNHSFRATGITAYLANGGALEHAQSDGCARKPAHDEAVRPHQGTLDAGRGGEDQVVTPHVHAAAAVKSEDRSSAQIGLDDLARLSGIAHADLKKYISRDPASREFFEMKILCVALCQGAALHFVDKANGVKDFDIFTFFAVEGGRRFPERRLGIHDFGPSHFGRHPEDRGFIGRRVDVIPTALCTDRCP